MLAATLNHIGNWHMNQERPAEALALHREALAIFERLDDRQGIAQTCDLLGIASYNACDLIGGRAHYERAIAIWRALDNRRGLFLSLGGLSLAIDYRLEVGHADVAQSLVWAHDCVQVSRPLGWRAGEALALIFRGLVHVQGGAYGPALVDLRAALAIAEEIEHREWTADSLHGLGKLSLDLLALDEAHACLTRSLELARELGSTAIEYRLHPLGPTPAGLGRHSLRPDHHRPRGSRASAAGRPAHTRRHRVRRAPRGKHDLNPRR